jgi:hypothetical protein
VVEEVVEEETVYGIVFKTAKVKNRLILELMARGKESRRGLEAYSQRGEPLAELFPFVVRYLTTKGNSAPYAGKSPFALRYRRVKRTFARGSCE